MFLWACPLADNLKSSSSSELIWKGYFASHYSKINFQYAYEKSQYKYYKFFFFTVMFHL